LAPIIGRLIIGQSIIGAPLSVTMQDAIYRNSVHLSVRHDMVPIQGQVRYRI